MAECPTGCLCAPESADRLSPFYNKTGSILKRPPEGWTLAPWVSITIKSSGRSITVGNESCPGTDNNAVIREFEFGQSDGFTCRVSIQDQQGSSFVAFMEDLIKDFKLLYPAGAIRMFIRWGWVKAGCTEPIPSQVSPIHVMMPDQIEANFAQGKFVFDITAKDLPFRMMEARSLVAKGDDKNKKSLKRALIELLTSNVELPTLDRVKFQRVEGKCVKPCGFKSGKPEHIPLDSEGKYFDDTNAGEKATYIPEARDKLATAKAWIKNEKSENDKGWIMSYDSTDNSMIFWEDPKPDCGKSYDYDAMSIGTYIVNGGKWSPVIEFNPKLRWNFADLQNVQGSMSTDGLPGLKGKGFHGTGEIGCDHKLTPQQDNPAGILTSAVVPARIKDANGKEGMKKVADSQNKDGKANRLLHREVQADLVLVGDPNMITPSLGIWARNVTIVFVNPYYIMPKGKGACGEWKSDSGLAGSACNPVFSSKAWWINRVTHKITPGHYTTSLGIYLAAGGVDLNTCDTLGGNGSSIGVCGTWKPVGCS